MLISWRRELEGSLLSLASLAGFYLVYGLVLTGRLPGGWAFLVFTAPAFLFLASWFAGKTLKRQGNLVARWRGQSMGLWATTTSKNSIGISHSSLWRRCWMTCARLPSCLKTTWSRAASDASEQNRKCFWSMVTCARRRSRWRCSRRLAMIDWRRRLRDSILKPISLPGC